MEITTEPYAIFDYSEFPLVKVTLTGNKATDKNFTAYLQEAHTIYKRGKYAFLMDTNGSTYLSSKFRIQQSNRIKEDEELIKNTVIGLVVITPSTIQRIVMNGIFLLNPYPAPYKMCKNEQEALDFLRPLIAQELK